jgi:hypothetical protein
LLYRQWIQIQTQRRPSKKNQQRRKFGVEDSISSIGRLDELFNEYYLNELQKAAASKFIKVRIGNKDDMKVQRLRDWLLLKLNKQRYAKMH